MMTLVAEITRIVQSYRKHNPDLVLFTSDVIDGGLHAVHAPFALVSHGTYQDSACSASAWPYGLIPNYRNCLWSCNWAPVRGDKLNQIAAEQYGLPQGVSCGYGENVGPADMPAEVLNKALRRFFKNVDGDRQRTRVLDSRARAGR